MLIEMPSLGDVKKKFNTVLRIFYDTPQVMTVLAREQ